MTALVALPDLAAAFPEVLGGMVDCYLVSARVITLQLTLVNLERKITSTGLATRKLSTEAIQGTSLPLQGIDNIHGSDSLPLGVLSVGDGIPDDILQEDLGKDVTSLLTLLKQSHFYFLTFRTPLVSS